MNSPAILLASLMAGTIITGIIPQNETYCNFSDTQQIQYIRMLEDFNSNQFKLYELDNGYAIYSYNDGEERFIEGSYETNSPYYQYLSYDLHYLGPGNYYYIDNDTTYDIIKQTSVSYTLENATYILPDNSAGGIDLLSTSTPDPTETTTDTSGFTVIKRHNYFRKLTYFPNNWFGECGLVALSIMLGYYDTFYNDNFIPNDLEYEAKYYTSTPSITLNYTSLQSLTRKGYAPYSADTVSYNFTDWTMMPGTNYAMRDYLMDNYLHTILGIANNDDGYPMGSSELKSSFNDYIAENCPSLTNSYQTTSGSIISTSNASKNSINLGNPTCLVLTDYTMASTQAQTTTNNLSRSSSFLSNAHIVVAYGYKDDNFLVHMGWNPNSTQYTQTILSSATIYAYYSITYTGTHVHSSNVTMALNGVKYGLCGCGQVTPAN